jgi:antitoxin component YwqK of YwqJK toxin-antitoxin module
MFKQIYFFVSMVCFFGYAQHGVNQLDAKGEKTGVWQKKYSNGNIRYKGQFLHGIEVGVFTFYSEYYSENPIIVKTYTGNGSICKVQFYSITGSIQSEGMLNGKLREGNWKYYDSSGMNIILEEHYKENTLSGEKKIYYSDGTLTELSNYKKGVLHGESLRYTDQGKLIARIPYDNGKIHGKIFYYHNSGVIRETGFYDHGKRVGRWEYYIDGILTSVKEPNKKSKKTFLKLKNN